MSSPEKMKVIAGENAIYYPKEMQVIHKKNSCHRSIKYKSVKQKMQVIDKKMLVIVQKMQVIVQKKICK